MNTRKRQRISYAEESSDDEEGPVTLRNRSSTQDNSKDDPVFRARSVYPRPKRAKRSKRPLFDYAKIFDLPADVLLMILAQLEPPTLWAISTASKPLQTLLASNECKGVWTKSFSNWKTYAPSDFIYELPHRQSHFQFCGPFRYYGFTETWRQNPNINELLENMSEADRVNYRVTLQLPLRPPPCPPEVLEFQYAKFLFSAKCDICQRSLKDRQYSIAEYCKRRCIECGKLRFQQLEEFLTEKQQSSTVDKARVLVEFTEFLCYEPYALLHHNGDTPTLMERVLVFDKEGGREELEQRLQLFRSKKAELAGPEYQTWCESREIENEQRRQRARHLLEFAYIRGMYDKYVSKQERETAARDKSEQRNRIFETLIARGGGRYSELELANRWSISFRNLLRNKQVLSEESGPAIQDQLLKYVAETKSRFQDNPHWTQEETGYLLARTYSRYKNAYGSFATPVLELSEPDLWTLGPCRTLAQSLALCCDRGDQMDAIEELFSLNFHKILKAARMRTSLIRDQLLDLLLDRKTDPDHEDENESNEDKWVLEKFKHPASYFRCEKCKNFYTWEVIVQHGCVTLDMEYDSHTSFLNNRAKTLCKPVGFQIARVSAPDPFPPLFEILAEAARAVGASSDWRFKDFTIPKTRSEAMQKHWKAWHFSCIPGVCEYASCPSSTPGDPRNQAYRLSFHEMMLHLFEKIEKKSLKLKDLDASKIRVYAGPAEK